MRFKYEIQTNHVKLIYIKNPNFKVILYNDLKEMPLGGGGGLFNFIEKMSFTTIHAKLSRKII